MEIYFDRKKLKILLDVFYHLTHVTISLFDNKMRCLLHTGGKKRYCLEIHSDPQLRKLCRRSDCENAKAVKNGGNCRRPYLCPAGICDAIAAIRYENITLGYCMIGKFVMKSMAAETERTVRRIAEENGMNTETMLNALSELPVLSQKDVDAAFLCLEAFLQLACREGNIRIDLEGFVSEIDSYFDKHIGETITVAGLCNTFHLSRSSLYDAFKKNFGMGPLDRLEWKRLDLAKRLLAETHMQTGEIAAAIGRKSTSYFCKWFKEKTGMTPLCYRKTHGGPVSPEE